MPQSLGRSIRNRRKNTRSHNKLFESLETRRLMAAVSIKDLGGIANDGRDDSLAFNAAIRAALGGGTVMIPAGTFNINSSVTIPSNLTIQGEGTASRLEFVTGRSSYAMVFENNGHDIKIDNLAIKANDGIISMNSGSEYRNITITNNDFQWGYDGTYFHRLAVQSTTSSDRLIIEHNYFHDSSSSDRNVDLWGMKNGSYSYNSFYYVNDGGHICDSRDNNRVSYNIGRKIHRMGIEIQTWNGITTNFTVQGNIFYDWDRPYTDSFGVSVMPQSGQNIRILDNYLAATFNGVWGQGVDGNAPHFGIGLEAGFTTGIVQNNTVIGPWVFGIMCSMPNTPVTGNKIYGTQRWGPITTEGGLRGHGSFISTNNLIDKDQSHAPPPPDTVGGDGGTDTTIGGDGGDGTTGEPVGDPPTGVTTFLSAFVNDSHTISLSWIDTYSDEEGYRVERSLDGKIFGMVFDSTVPGTTKYKDQGLPSGTVVWYRVAAYKAGVQGDYSNPVMARTFGPPAGSTTQSFAVKPGSSSSTMFTPVVPPLNDDSHFSDTLITTL